MTLPASTRRNDHTGNGSASTYSYGFKVFDDDDLLVIVADADGVETTLTKTTDYTVTGVEEAAGGTIVLVNASQAWLTAGGNLKSGYHLTILGNRSFLQDTRIRDEGPYYPNVIEDEWDKQVVLLQQLKEKVNRCITFQKTSTESAIEAKFSLSGNAGKILAVNDDEDGIELGPTVASIAADKAAAAASAATASSAASSASTSSGTASTSAAAAAASAAAAAASAAAAAASVSSDGKELAVSGTYGGADTTYTLAQTPLANTLIVFLNGIMRTDYSISTATITFSGQDTTGQTMDCFYRY